MSCPYCDEKQAEIERLKREVEDLHARALDDGNLIQSLRSDVTFAEREARELGQQVAALEQEVRNAREY